MDIQGFLSIVTLDGTVITAQLNDVSLTEAKNVMSKPTMDGTGSPTQLVGQRTGTLTVNGQVDTVGLEGLQDTYLKDAPVVFKLEVGDGVTINAGHYDGNVVLAQFDKSASADGSWDFVLSGATDSVSFTPPA